MGTTLLAIHGSPRAQGNTDILLRQVLRGAGVEGTEEIFLRDLGIGPCMGCGMCEGESHCVIDDDMNLLYPLMDQAEIILLAAPVYFYGLPSHVKMMIDRCQPFWWRRVAEERKGRSMTRGRGLLISTGASEGQKLFTGSLLTMKYFLHALSKEMDEGLLVRNVDSRGEILLHEEPLEAAFKLGKRLRSGKGRG